MNQASVAAAPRAVALLAASVTATGSLLLALRPLLLVPTVGFDQLLTAGAAWLLLACAAWAVLICLATVVETLTAGRLRATAWVCPAPARRALLTALGVVLASGTAGPGWAARAPTDVPVHADGSASVSAAELAGAVRAARPLPVPDRQAGPTRRARVDVRAGDTLWRLAEQRLAPTAAAGEVARLVERMHRLNREVVGPDPDLIRPGQHLLLPRLFSGLAPRLPPRPSRFPGPHRHLQEKS